MPSYELIGKIKVMMKIRALLILDLFRVVLSSSWLNDSRGSDQRGKKKRGGRAAGGEKGGKGLRHFSMKGENLCFTF
jgi:hypothetical protein